jgi:hypothetical protein
MAELKIYLSDSLSEKFRRIAMSVYGYGRGSLSKAAEEAFARWCSEHEHSHVPEMAAQRSQTPQDDRSGETESHVNPDERVGEAQETNNFGEDRSLKSTGSST